MKSISLWVQTYLLKIGKGNGPIPELVNENKFIVMARNGIDMLSAISKSPILRNADNGYTFYLIDKGIAMEISSSYTRNEYKLGGEPLYLLPDSRYEYIKEHQLYR